MNKPCLSETQTVLQQLKAYVSQHIIGQDTLVERMLIALRKIGLGLAIKHSS